LSLRIELVRTGLALFDLFETRPATKKKVLSGTHLNEIKMKKKHSPANNLPDVSTHHKFSCKPHNNSSVTLLKCEVLL